MRRLISFACDGRRLAGTLDEGTAPTGILIVSGGNEIRIGAHRGMAKLARDIAAKGYPVFRFDRRGIGDSDGDNKGFESSGPDIAAALTEFRSACPSVKHVIAFGNCDAATALLLHQPLCVDALVLANPWLIEASTDAPAPASARAYYRQRLKDPRAWGRLFKGAVKIGRLFGSLRAASRKDVASSLSMRVADQMTLFPVDTAILLAEHDATAIAFKAQWNDTHFESIRARVPLTTIDSASHSFASNADHAALVDAILVTLAQCPAANSA